MTVTLCTSQPSRNIITLTTHLIVAAEARYSYSPPPEIAEFPLRFQSTSDRDARRFQPENAFA